MAEVDEEGALIEPRDPLRRTLAAGFHEVIRCSAKLPEGHGAMRQALHNLMVVKNKEVREALVKNFGSIIEHYCTPFDIKLAQEKVIKLRKDYEANIHGNPATSVPKSRKDLGFDEFTKF